MSNTGESPVPSFDDLRELYGSVGLREAPIRDLKSGLKQARRNRTVALASVLRYLDDAYGNNRVLSDEDHYAASKRSGAIFHQKKQDDDALKALEDRIKEEETKRDQDLLAIKSWEAAVQRAPVVTVSLLKDVELIWYSKIKCRRLELVRGNDPREVELIRKFCESHSLEIIDATAAYAQP